MGSVFQLRTIDRIDVLRDATVCFQLVCIDFTDCISPTAMEKGYLPSR
ncbi:MAG TPA: hypothetical protein PL065_07480 [Polyangiaceae bacterium]|jgi:hypothetical protein|nr:hypothetical protein [Polyangiaceae bacterium]HQF23287.1 hypothetical protein [Polyangiaceae bacterium]